MHKMIGLHCIRLSSTSFAIRNNCNITAQKTAFNSFFADHCIYITLGTVGSKHLIKYKRISLHFLWTTMYHSVFIKHITQLWRDRNALCSVIYRNSADKRQIRGLLWSNSNNGLYENNFNWSHEIFQLMLAGNIVQANLKIRQPLLLYIIYNILHRMTLVESLANNLQKFLKCLEISFWLLSTHFVFTTRFWHLCQTADRQVWKNERNSEFCCRSLAALGQQWG